MNGFEFLWLLMVAAILMFWIAELREVITMKDSQFEGHNDKLIWFVLVFFGSVFGAFAFYLWNKGRERERQTEQEFGKFLKDKEARDKS